MAYEADAAANELLGPAMEDFNFEHPFDIEFDVWSNDIEFDVLPNDYIPRAHRLVYYEDAPDAADHPMAEDLADDGVPPTKGPVLDHRPSEFAFVDNPAPEGAMVVLRDIESPHAKDVVCGRGNAKTHHNRWYLERAKERKAGYDKTHSRLAKRRIAKGIVDLVRSRQPPGRFLTREVTTGLWNDIGDEAAIVKSSQCLREAPTRKIGSAVTHFSLDPVRV
jgi:hypothetical protein